MKNRTSFDRTATRLLSTLLCALGLASASPQAAAQLDLPEKERSRAWEKETGGVEIGRKGNSLKSRMLGGEQREQRQDDVLTLPNELRSPRWRRSGSGMSAADQARAARLTPPGALGPQVDFIFEQLRRVRTVDDPLVDAAVASLGRLGEEGLMVARLELFGDQHAPTVLGSALALVAFGDEDDWHLVVDRFHQPLPKSAAGAIVEGLLRFDPVRASPVLLASLLDHPQNAVRSVSSKYLAAAPPEEVLPLLATMLESKRADTRLRVIDLAADIPQPAAIDLLFIGLTDSSAKVARRSIDALSARDEERVVSELKQRAFDEPWILRDSAYALLVLIEREDLRFETHLDESYADVLGVALDSNDAFVAGTAAAALAGIGFRSPQLQAAWLDREVPLQLVRTVSGAEFHADYGSLEGIALRRLSLIAGESFGSDGPAWVEWWGSNGAQFRARRAWIAATIADATRLSVRVTDVEQGLAFRLIGPDLAVAFKTASSVPGTFGENLFLSSSQAQDLFRLIEDEGVLGPDRLPGTRGRELGGRSIDIEIGDRRKSFRFGPRAADPWFERLFVALEVLRSQNRWQNYPDPGRYASSYELWLVEQSWWDDQRSQLERDRRLADMILAWIPGQASRERDLGVDELVELYADPALRRAADFRPLVDMLISEPFLGARSRAIIRLAEQSAAEIDGARAGVLPEELANDLLESVLDAFGPESASEISSILAAAGRERVREAARDGRPFLRAVAADTLCRDPRPEDIPLLEELLRDPIEAVEIASIEAVGKYRVEGLRTELFVRARIGRAPVRAAALEAVGRIGGSEALDALLVGLSNTSAEVREASARGLAVLGDPTSAPLLIDLLGTQRDSEMVAVARTGLLDMGQGAWIDLMRTVNMPSHPARREAALLLARQGVPEAASALLRLASEKPDDTAVLWELAVLTCVDMRAQLDPVASWWTWWDDVNHDDARAWFVAALVRAGEVPPPPVEFEGHGTRAARHTAWSALGLEDADYLVERARRELGRMLGRDLGEVPVLRADREAWRVALYDVLNELPEVSQDPASGQAPAAPAASGGEVSDEELD